MSHGTRGHENETSNGVANKMQAATILVKENPDIAIQDLVASMRSRFSMRIDPKVAENYRYKIRRKLGLRIKKRPSSTIQAAGPINMTVVPTIPKRPSTGLDDLLTAGKLMGWCRVKEIVDQITQSPDMKNARNQYVLSVD